MNRYICRKCKAVSIVNLKADDIDIFCTECSPETKVRHSKTIISVPMTNAMVREIVPALQPKFVGIPEAPKPNVDIKPTKGNLIVPATK